MTHVFGPVTFGLIAFGLVLTGCAHYEPDPLDPVAEFEAVDARRRSFTPDLDDDGRTRFGPVALWAVEHGPRARDLRAAHETALARAEVKAPLPNPQFAIGPRYGFGADATMESVVTPMGRLTFRIPLGDRRGREDDRDRAVATAAGIDYLTGVLEADLELRQAWVEWSARRAEAGRYADAAEAWSQALRAEQQAIDAGRGDAMVLAEVRVEAVQQQLRRLDAETAALRASSRVAHVAGISSRALGEPVAFDAVEFEDLPPIESLRGRLPDSCPSLLRRRAAFEVAERQLALEVALALPDIGIGPTFEGENGETLWLVGLQLQFQIPLFDRNQKAIASALAARDRAREAWRAAADRALTDLESAHTEAELALERAHLVDAELVPASVARLDAVRVAVEAGASDRRDLIRAQLAVARARIEAAAARRAAAAAIGRIEQLIGEPLVSIPGDRPDAGASGNAASAAPPDRPMERTAPAQANRDGDGAGPTDRNP